jgi:hypothetical protein
MDFGGGGGSGDAPDDGSGGAPSVAFGGTIGSPGGAGVGGTGGTDGSSLKGGGGGGGGGVTGGGGGGGGNPGGGGGGGSSYSVDPHATLGVAATPVVTIAPPCTAGYYSSTGFGPCTAASEGYYVPGGQATSEDECSAGSYQDQTGQTGCKSASIGYYVPGGQATSEDECSAGSYQDQTGQTGCKSASIGYYVDSPGAVSATACPAGETTAATGSTSESDCVGAPQITSSSTKTFSTGSGTFTVTTTGVPTPSLSDSSPVGGCTASVLPSGLSFSDNGDGTATIASTGVTGGVYTFCLTASNGVGSAATQTFLLTGDQGPSIPSGFSSDPFLTFVSGQVNSYTFPVYGYPIPSASVSGCGGPPSGVSVVQNLDGSVTISTTTAPVALGEYMFCINFGNTVSSFGQEVDLTIDQAPAIASADSATFTSGTAGSFKVTTTGKPTPSLSNSDFGVCSASVLPAGVSFTDNGDGTATIAATATSVTGGTYTLCLNAANGEGSNATQQFTLTIDQAPGFISGTSAMFTPGTAGSFTVETVGFPVPSLTNASYVGCTASSLPSGLTFTDNGNDTGTIAATATAIPGGTYTLCLTAANGIGSAATQKFTVQVGQPPSITSASAKTFTSGTAGSFKVTTTGTPAPALSDSTPVGGCTASSLPSGLSFTDNGDGTAKIAATASAIPGGVYTLCLTASNGVSPNATQKFLLTVDQAPSITSANNATFTVGMNGSFKVTTSAFPVDAALSDGGVSLPSGITFHDNGDGTATLSGKPVLAGVGSITFTITANNGISPNGTQRFTLTVLPPPAALTAPAVNREPQWISLATTLTDGETGAPIAGATLVFQVGSQTECVLKTFANGYQTCPVYLSAAQVRSATSYTISYVGSPTHQPVTVTGVLYYQAPPFFNSFF